VELLPANLGDGPYPGLLCAATRGIRCPCAVEPRRWKLRFPVVAGVVDPAEAQSAALCGRSPASLDQGAGGCTRGSKGAARAQPLAGMVGSLRWRSGWPGAVDGVADGAEHLH
jgi:hypothetical protein